MELKNIIIVFVMLTFASILTFQDKPIYNEVPKELIIEKVDTSALMIFQRYGFNMYNNEFFMVQIELDTIISYDEINNISEIMKQKSLPTLKNYPNIRKSKIPTRIVPKFVPGVSKEETIKQRDDAILKHKNDYAEELKTRISMHQEMGRDLQSVWKKEIKSQYPSARMIFYNYSLPEYLNNQMYE